MPPEPVVWAGAAALWLTTLPVHAQPIAGMVEYVVDGDTLTVAGETVRLWGIDAPELRQTCTRTGESYPCGQVARYVLLSFVKGRTITCRERDRDRYRRIVASCQVAGRDLGVTP